jgi:hypothetical protein
MVDMLHQRRGMADEDGDLEVPWGYCWGYTKWVYQRRSPKPASPGGPSGWYGGFTYQATQLLEAHGGTGCRRLWQIQRQAHGRLSCSTRIGLSLGLQVVSTPVPMCSPRQAPL